MGRGGLMRVRIWVATVFLCSAVQAAAEPARAATSRAPRVTPIAVPLDTPSFLLAPQVQAQAEQVLMLQDKFEGYFLVDAVDPQAAKERRRKRQEAEAVMAAGQKAYDELDTQKSMQ